MYRSCSRQSVRQKCLSPRQERQKPRPKTATRTTRRGEEGDRETLNVAMTSTTALLFDPRYYSLHERLIYHSPGHPFWREIVPKHTY